MPEVASTVPASVVSQQSSPDIGELLKNIVTPIDPNLIRAATSPVPGSHAQMVPSSLTTPVAPHQDRPFDTSEVVGKGNATARGVKNAFTGATNALGAIVTKEAQIKQGQIRDAAQKVIMAQQGYDEAKQALAAAALNLKVLPAISTWRSTAQRYVMQQNQQARDAIFTDPKMRKALQKGFDISYTDPESNKTEEHAAVQDALKNAKTFAEKKAIMKAQQQKQNEAAGTAMGAAFEKSQPQGLAPNTQAQAQLQAAQQQQKLQVDSIKALVPYFSAQVRAGSLMSIADKKNAVDLRVHAMEQQTTLEKQILENNQKNIDNEAARSLARLKASLQNWINAADAANPANVMKGFQTAADDFQKNTDAIQKSRQALNTELDKKPGAARETEIRRQLIDLDQQDTVSKGAFEAAKNFAVKQSGMDPKQFEITVPTPQVGAGVSNATGSGTSPVSDIDPRTGKPFKSSVSTTDRILVKALSGLSGVYAKGSSTASEITNDLDRAERALDRDSGSGN